MKKWIALLLLGVPGFLMAQAPESHQKTYFQGEDGKLYWNKYLPFYLHISSSPEDKGMLLESEQTSEYANPAYFDTEGQNFIRTKNAVDKNTMNPVNPPIEIMWEVYADGIAPATNIHFNDAKVHKQNEVIYYGDGLSVSLESTDGMSGVKNTYITTGDQVFVPYSDPIAFTLEGEKFISYYAADHVGNVEEVVTKKFVIDLTAPVSALDIEGVQKDYIVGTSSRLTLNVNDNLSGVKQTFVSIDDEDPFVYDGGYINKNQLPDGEHTLKFYSLDYVGNKENEQTHQFYLDKLPPIIAADALGDRYLAAGKEYFSGRTKLKLTAVDNKSGVKDIHFAVNDGEFQNYNEAFYLPSRSGYHIIRYYAVDYMGNESFDDQTHQNFERYEHNVQKVYVDLTGPTIDYRINGPNFTKRDTVYISPASKISISGDDKESGLQYLSYSLDGKPTENTYSAPFSISQDGLHTIDYFGYDNVNNRNKKSCMFIVDADPPKIFSNFSVPSYAINSDSVPIFPAYVKLYIGATDFVTGNDQLLVSLNGGAFKPYTGQIDGFEKGVVNEVKMKAIDKVQNERTHIVQFIIE